MNLFPLSAAIEQKLKSVKCTPYTFKPKWIQIHSRLDPTKRMARTAEWFKVLTILLICSNLLWDGTVWDFSAGISQKAANKIITMLNNTIMQLPSLFRSNWIEKHTLWKIALNRWDRCVCFSMPTVISWVLIHLCNMHVCIKSLSVFSLHPTFLLLLFFANCHSCLYLFRWDFRFVFL